MWRLACMALLAITACGPRVPQRVDIAHSVIDVGAAAVYEADAEVYRRLHAEPVPCDQACTQPYDRAAKALSATREALIAARHALSVVEAQEDGNPGAVISCAAAAVARALRVAEAAGARPSTQTLQVWARYAAMVGTMCELGTDPDAKVYRGEAPAEAT